MNVKFLMKVASVHPATAIRGNSYRSWQKTGIKAKEAYRKHESKEYEGNYLLRNIGPRED